MKVTVNQANISRGKRDNTDECPLAIAVRRTLRIRDSSSVRVGKHKMFILDWKGYIHGVLLPKEVRLWIQAYDHWGKGGVHPATFDLPIETAKKTLMK